MTENTTTPPEGPRVFPCGGCGARLEFAPGTERMLCPYCGHTDAVAAPERRIREHKVQDLFRRTPMADLVPHELVCQGCGAHLQSDQLAHNCQFCASPLVIDPASEDVVPPEAVLPFAVDRSGARGALASWTRTRWFAPNSLKKVGEAERLKSTYLPHWTFDAATASDYKGQRGEYYYVTETYTTQENGKTVTKTRQVRKTRWYPASGRVSRDFDDVLVNATTRLSPERVTALEPWDLKQARPFTHAYLAGHEALRYDMEPEEGLDRAKGIMAKQIDKDCRRDIGGDEQRVHSVSTRYSDVTGKLMLLPVWAGAYLHGGKSYQMVINGQTGEVQGERPYSAVKIAFAVLAMLAVVALLVYVYLQG